MKNMTKAIAFLLMIALCFGMMAVSVSATDFTCEMALTTYNASGMVMVRVSTSEAAGAISGTLSFDNQLLSFDPEHTLCYAEDAQVTDLCAVEGNSISFAIATDNVTDGSTHWIDFAFTVKSQGTAVFSISNGQAVDLAENLCQNIAVDPISVSVGDAIVKWNLILGDSIGTNFYVQVEDAANTQVRMTVAGSSAVINASNVQPNEEGYYVFSANMAAAQMTDTINVEVLENGQIVDSGSYSVRQYADTILSGDYTAQVKTLVKAMLNYGGKAQTYFNYNIDNLANTGISVTDAAVPTEGGKAAVSGSVEGISFYGASIVHREKTVIRFYFTADSIDGVDFGGYTAKEKDGMYYIEVTGINPQDLDNDITVTINGSMTVTYAPMNYIIRMYNRADNSDNIKALVQALYGYYLAAVEYTK